MADAQEAGEAGHPAGGEPVVTIGDVAAYRRRLRAQCVAETAANAKAQPVGPLHHQRTDHACMLATSWRVADHPCLGIVEGLELEHLGAAAGPVAGMPVMQYQAFTALGHDCPQL